MTLGQKLRALRKAARLTPAGFRLRWQVAFGEALPSPTAYGWEQRHSAPTPANLGRFLWVCGADDAQRLEVYDCLSGYDQLERP